MESVFQLNNSLTFLAYATGIMVLLIGIMLTKVLFDLSKLTKNVDETVTIAKTELEPTLKNINKSVEPKDISFGTQGDKGFRAQYGFISFNSDIEKNNFTEFYYRNGKNGLMHKLIKGLNKSSGSIELAIPRVDWSHPWTDEEILKEYGYTEEEIKEILEWNSLKK